MANERRINSRRKFGYYMRVMDNGTNELVGYLSDISPRGFKLDCLKLLTVGKDYTLRLDLTSEVSDRLFIVFVANVKWSRQDPFDPNSFIVGFQITNIAPRDEEIFNRILEKYGKTEVKW
jgi:hypothetical protein